MSEPTQQKKRVRIKIFSAIELFRKRLRPTFSKMEVTCFSPTFSKIGYGGFKLRDKGRIAQSDGHKVINMAASGTFRPWGLETSIVGKLIRKRTHQRRGPNSRLGSKAAVIVRTKPCLLQEPKRTLIVTMSAEPSEAVVNWL